MIADATKTSPMPVELAAQAQATQVKAKRAADDDRPIMSDDERRQFLIDAQRSRYDDETTMRPHMKDYAVPRETYVYNG